MARHRVAMLLALVAGALVLTGALVWAGNRSSAPVEPPTRHTAVVSALRVLEEWDARRAAAYAEGTVGRLRDLYVPGSSAGAADLRLLREYRARGLRVAGMRTQVFSLAVLEQGRDRYRVRVTDRLVGAVAVGRGRRRELPRDTASTRVLTLMRASDGRWRVSTVVDR